MVKSQKPKSVAGLTSADQAAEAAARALVAKHPEGLPRAPDPVADEALPAVPPPAPAENPDAGFHRALGREIHEQAAAADLGPVLPIALELDDDERALLATTGAPNGELTTAEFQCLTLHRLAVLHGLVLQACQQTRAPAPAAPNGGMVALNSGLTPADLEGLAMAAEEKGQKSPTGEARKSWDTLAKKCRDINTLLRG